LLIPLEKQVPVPCYSPSVCLATSGWPHPLLPIHCERAGFRPAPLSTHVANAGFPPAPLSTHVANAGFPLASAGFPPPPLSTHVANAGFPPAPLSTHVANAGFPPAPLSTHVANAPQSRLLEPVPPKSPLRRIIPLKLTKQKSGMIPP
jgi:hypothetical protein